MLPRRRRVAQAAHDVRAAAAAKRHEMVTFRTLRRVVDVLGAHAPVLVKPFGGDVDGARRRSRRLLGRQIDGGILRTEVAAAVVEIQQPMMSCSGPEELRGVLSARRLVIAGYESYGVGTE